MSRFRASHGVKSFASCFHTSRGSISESFPSPDSPGIKPSIPQVQLTPNCAADGRSPAVSTNLKLDISILISFVRMGYLLKRTAVGADLEKNPVAS